MQKNHDEDPLIFLTPVSVKTAFQIKLHIFTDLIWVTCLLWTYHWEWDGKGGGMECSDWSVLFHLDNHRANEKVCPPFTLCPSFYLPPTHTPHRLKEDMVKDNHS